MVEVKYRLYFVDDGDVLSLNCMCNKCRVNLSNLEFCKSCNSGNDLFINPKNLYHDLYVAEYRI